MDLFQKAVAKNVAPEAFLYNRMLVDYHNRDKKIETYNVIAQRINEERRKRGEIADGKSDVDYYYIINVIIYTKKTYISVLVTADEVKTTYFELKNDYRVLQKKLRDRQLFVELLEGYDKDIYDHMGFLRTHVHCEDGLPMQ